MTLAMVGFLHAGKGGHLDALHSGTSGSAAFLRSLALSHCSQGTGEKACRSSCVNVRHCAAAFAQAQDEMLKVLSEPPQVLNALAHELSQRRARVGCWSQGRRPRNSPICVIMPTPPTRLLRLLK